MTLDSLTPLFASAVAAAIPLLLAALGELITERSGVLNLGVEGMMLMGGVTAFIVVAHGGGLTLATIAACCAGMIAALMFAFVTLTLQASQVAAGLALAILGSGVSAFLGRGYVGNPAKVSFSELPIPLLSKLPIVGPALFSMNALGYLAVILTVATTWFLYRTKSGLILRSVGESPVVAQSLGLQVIRLRYLATLFGGLMAGLAGCYYAVAQFKMWQEGLTSGNGWIALALVVFASWRPVRLMLGALLFGGVTAFGLYLQAVGVQVSAFALASLPYIATVVVLAVISRDQRALRRNAPASLGQSFFGM
ncbi:MAG TPA: ABC transporter permease [Burkholderiales bacterium]|jgi:simple sugar transport system permease protein|nr:ABC transporter permease [Burkholderiales bacterium]